MALVMIPFLAGYSRSAAPPRAPSRELRRASSAPAQIFHAGAAMQAEEAVKRQGNSRGPTEFQLNLGQLVDSLRTGYPLLFVEPMRCGGVLDDLRGLYPTISVSLRWRDCSFYAACDLTALHTDVQGFRSGLAIARSPI